MADPRRSVRGVIEGAAPAVSVTWALHKKASRYLIPHHRSPALSLDLRAGSNAYMSNGAPA